MNSFMISNRDEAVMILLHYFITEENYNPIVLHGAKDEVWLEKMDADYKIVKISSKYIHNDEQFDFDLFKTNQIIKSIKKKTYSYDMETLAIFLNLGDNVSKEKAEGNTDGIITSVKATEASDIAKYNIVSNIFPNVSKKLKFDTTGTELFVKLTEDINKKNEEDSKKMESLFEKKTPFATYTLVALNILVFVLILFIGKTEAGILNLTKFGAFDKDKILNGEIYRLFTSLFIHAGVLHLLVNNYALYVIGPQIEGFFGKYKYVLIYLLSGLLGNIMSLPFIDGLSVGASGAIFGLLGSLLYFGYYYRVYLGTVLKSQIVPLIILNIMIGFMLPNINNTAHIGGLIGGMLATMIVGVPYKYVLKDRINGVIIYLIFSLFLIYLALNG